MNTTTQIVIVDFGSQYTTLIARSLTELGFNSLIVKPETLDSHLRQFKPKALILSGGNNSVYDKEAPTISPDILNGEYFVLGICYGMQLIVHLLGGKVVNGSHAQKGYAGVNIKNLEGSRTNPVFKNLPAFFRAWASHGDVVIELPHGFVVNATSGPSYGFVIETMSNNLNGKIFGLQFHPEVKDTQHGDVILKNFLDLSGCVLDWNPEEVIPSITRKVEDSVGEGKAFIGVSGGVDSTTLALLISKYTKVKLYPCLIDHGGMRENEIREVVSFCKKAGVILNVVHAAPLFFKALKRTVDPEKRRKVFQRVYKKVFEQVIKQGKITHIIQGTLATDLIESGSKGNSALIKTHHNVGLKFSVPEIQPFGHLFKYQVRDISRSLGLDKIISERKPFPGPGLYLRVLGVPPTPKMVKLARFADTTVKNILEKEDFYSKISQIIVAVDGARTVGIKGDARVLGYSVIVRTVSTSDFMTVKPYFFLESVMEKIIAELTKHKLIVRVYFDFTPKPPATTEFY
jgi:GMP synthase (glutamine-hydrolysing)